jgi:hypothetical protein
MPFFKVRIRKPRGILGGHGEFINPFEPVDLLNANLRAHYIERVWERMEAKDEAEIRAYFAEAQKNHLPNVEGFELASIEPAA